MTIITNSHPMPNEVHVTCMLTTTCMFRTCYFNMHVGMHVVDLFGNAMCMLNINKNVTCILIPTYTCMTFNKYIYAWITLLHLNNNIKDCFL